jgi:integration host factor subunit alpha
MTKADMVELVYERIGVSKREAATVVESIFDIIKESLERGENVKISGFGSFNLREKKPRRGRNPQTGEEITISARRVLSFKSSNVLRDQLNP